MSRLKALIPAPLKKYFLSPIKRRVDDVIIWLQLAIFAAMRAWRKRHPLNKTFAHSYSFVILCIKKTGYADLVINNVNSLHYRNPTHHVYVQCDDICYQYLKAREHKFDYPAQVTLELVADAAETLKKGWQFFKVEAIIAAAQNDRILFDADTFWHEDISIDRDKITMLANCKTMGDDAKSAGVIMHVFNKPEWMSFQHNVAAFASIPKKLMTDKIAEDMRKFNQMVQDHPLDFVTNEHDRTEIRRLSEEYAVNLSIQNNYPQNMLVVLKDEDGVKNRSKMESLYYGSRNRIIE